MSFKPYPKYIESGTPWISNHPSDWEMLKTKYLFKERVEKGYPNEPLLAATQTLGVVPKTLFGTRTVIAQKDLHLLKLVEPGDFVISLRSFQGGIEKAYYRGIISPAYTILIPSYKIDGGYFKHLAKSKPFIKLLTNCVTGIREGQNIDYEILRRTKLPVPSILDQKHIARYLDLKTSQIAKFKKAKKRMIELLKEQKQVIINDAVTGKLDVRTGNPYPKYKDSEVEWLGMVPEEWEVLFVRQITKYVKTGGTPKNASEKHFNENGVNWFTPCDFSETLYLTNAKRKLSKLGYQEVSVFPKGSVLMIGIGATIGKASICLEEVSCNQQINVLIPKDNILNLYLVYILRLLKPYVLECGKFTTLPILNQDDTKKLRVPLPVIAIQEVVITYLKERLSKIDTSILKIEEEIKLIIEYRTRLIADVVTGKIDVRDVNVPDFREEDFIADLEETSDTEAVLDESTVDNDL